MFHILCTPDSLPICDGFRDEVDEYDPSLQCLYLTSSLSYDDRIALLEVFEQVTYDLYFYVEHFRDVLSCVTLKHCHLDDAHA